MMRRLLGCPVHAPAFLHSLVVHMLSPTAYFCPVGR
jgi:hypothetical protein